MEVNYRRQQQLCSNCRKENSSKVPHVLAIVQFENRNIFSENAFSMQQYGDKLERDIRCSEGNQQSTEQDFPSPRVTAQKAAVQKLMV